MRLKKTVLVIVKYKTNNPMITEITQGQKIITYAGYRAV